MPLKSSLIDAFNQVENVENSNLELSSTQEFAFEKATPQGQQTISLDFLQSKSALLEINPYEAFSNRTKSEHVLQNLNNQSTKNLQVEKTDSVSNSHHDLEKHEQITSDNLPTYSIVSKSKEDKIVDSSETDKYKNVSAVAKTINSNASLNSASSYLASSYLDQDKSSCSFNISDYVKQINSNATLNKGTSKPILNSSSSTYLGKKFSFIKNKCATDLMSNLNQFALNLYKKISNFNGNLD